MDIDGYYPSNKKQSEKLNKVKRDRRQEDRTAYKKGVHF